MKILSIYVVFIENMNFIKYRTVEVLKLTVVNGYWLGPTVFNSLSAGSTIEARETIFTVNGFSLLSLFLPKSKVYVFEQ